MHLKCDCLLGSLLNGSRQPFLFSFALDKPRCQNRYTEPRIKLFKNINESVLTLIKFYFLKVDQKPVDFNQGTISFTCQLVKK